MNTKCVYNLRLAGYLMMNGVPIKRVEKNLGRPWRNVYLFDASEKIEELIEIYKQEKSKETIDDTNKNSDGSRGR